MIKVPVELLGQIRSFKSFLITAHIRPDGDAVGSMLAFYQILRKLGKRVTIQNASPLPSNFRFLPGAEKIRPYGRLPFRPEVAIILDSPSRERLGEVKQHLDRIGFLINIDHHISNKNFAHSNWLCSRCSSVGEMIYYLLPRLGVKLSRSLALCLYVAILTDMGKFQFMVTPEDGFRILNLAARLVKTGLVPYEIYKQVFNVYSPGRLQLLAEVLQNLRFSAGGQIAYMTITRDMLRRYGIIDDTNDELISHPRDLSSTRVAVLFTEKEGRIKVSLRSKEPHRIDVNRIAVQLGGGGHPAAAGVELPGNLGSVQKKILRAIAQRLGPNRG